MPTNALEYVVPDHLVPLAELGGLLVRFTTERAPAKPKLALVKRLVQKLIGELVNRPFYKRTATDSALSPKKNLPLTRSGGYLWS